MILRCGWPTCREIASFHAPTISTWVCEFHKKFLERSGQVNLPDDEQLLRGVGGTKFRSPEEWAEAVGPAEAILFDQAAKNLDKLNQPKGVKFNQAKPRSDLFSTSALLGLAEVLRYGANKYAADNWRKGMEWRRLTGAALRHLLALQAGEDVDPESGLPHVDHLMCCAMFLSEFQKTGNGVDDRYKERKV